MIRTSSQSYGVIFLCLVAACGDSPAPGSTPLLPPVEAGVETGAPALPGPDAGSADGGASDAAPDAPAAPKVTTLVVVYPAAGKPLEVRGSVPPLSWDVGTPMKPLGNDTYELTIAEGAGAFEWKPLLGGTWSRGPNYRAAKGQSTRIYPHFTQVKGAVDRRNGSFTSTVLPSTRGLWVYLPPSYLENSLARFPVVYMHDGQNLFSASSAFGGNEWGVDETMDAAAESGAAREAIVIGIDNTPARMDELTPTRDDGIGAGGKGESYVSMVATELKPLVDIELRTLASPEETGIMGSSLGGLISVYAGVERGDVFGLVGAMSPSTWWDNRMIITRVGTLPQKAKRPLRVYVDSGNAGASNDDVNNTKDLAQAMRGAGYIDDSSLKYEVQAGATHSEVYWAQRLPSALAFLLGPGR